MFLAGLEPATFHVLGGCDNHYTTETTLLRLGLTEHRLSLAPEMHGLNYNFACLMLKQQLASKLDPAAAF